MTKKTGEGAQEIRVETSDSGPVSRTLTVEVAAARVNKAYDRSYRDLAKSAAVRGFRKGKVPRSVLERLYGASIGEEIERNLVGETLPDAVELAEITPVSEPDIDADEPSPDAPFTYRARIEVKPEIELPELTGLAAEKPAVDVSEVDVQAELEKLRENNAPLIEEPEDTPAADGHHLGVDFVGRVDGEAFEGGNGKDVTIEIGSGRMIPGFEEQLIGAKSGDDVEVNVTFPEDYHATELAGKSAAFACHVVSVRRREVPGLDDEFAKDLGDFETLEDLRSRVRGDMASQKEKDAQQVLRRTLMDSLVERASFEVPPGMVDRQIEQQIQSMHQQFQGQMPHDVLHAQLDRMREEGRPAAERRVREGLLLEAVATQKELEVGDDALDARLEEMAEQQGMPAEDFKKLAHEREFAEVVRAELLDQAALDFLSATAKVEETTDT